VRYRTYEVLKKETNNPSILWAYLPYSMHMAGPREAIQHMIIRKNYGCTHFIIGRDMAGSKSSLDGEDFYGAYDAQVRTREGYVCPSSAQGDRLCVFSPTALLL
jgi:sulfate adenylyltransferase